MFSYWPAVAGAVAVRVWISPTSRNEIVPIWPRMSSSTDTLVRGTLPVFSTMNVKVTVSPTST